MDIRKPIPNLAFSHGIADLGFLYERLLVSHLSIKCTLRSDVKDFRLVLNAKNHGHLDDIIIHIFDENGLSEVLACQLKHKENKGEIRDFLNLNKYEKSFEELRDIYGPNIKITVVLFTNASKSHPKGVYAKPVIFEKNEILSIFSTNGEKGQCYKLENDNLEFYENCFLFCHQIRAINGNQLLLSDLDGCFNMKQTQCIENYFQKTIPKRKNPITKQEINFIIRDILISSFVWALDPSPENLNPPNTELLLNTMNTFNYSKISETNCKYVLKSIVDFIEKKLNIDLSKLQWNEVLSTDIVDNLIQIEEIANYAKLKIAYKPLIKEDLWLLFWASGELPLIVKTDQSNCNQIKFILKHLASNVTPNVSVIFCDECNIINNNNDDLKVFDNLSDLKPLNENLLQEILEKTKVSLNFKEISLREIVNENVDLLKTINPDALIELLCENIKISTVNETLPFYIDRQLQVPLYSKDVTKCTEFISIVDDNMQHLENSCGAVGRTSYSDNTTEITAKLVSEQSFCCFQTFGDKYYCYLKNLKNPDVIEKYLTDEIINEEELLRFQNGSQIIHGPAGIGKKTFLKNLATKSTLNNLYIYIDINNPQGIIESFETKKSLADYLSDIIINCQKYESKLFIKAFILMCLEKNRVHLLFDGFDESNAKPEIFDRLSNKLRVPFIICTRSNKIIEKQTFLKTSSVFQLLEFNLENQEEFIRKSCKNPLHHQEIIDKIVKTFSMTPTINFLGIPFHMHLLMEKYQEIKEHIKQWNLVNILEKFMEIQMQAFLKRHISRTIRYLACSLFFENDILTKLHINTKNFEEDLEDLLNCPINMIITNVDTSKEIQFTHRVYADFLCAQYLSNLLININPEELRNYSTIFKLLFAEDLIQVRFFFDLLVSRGMPLFRAVLLNDYNKVTEILNYDENCYLNCDKLGRTVFHIIMGYGVRYNYPYKVDGLKNIRKQTSYNIFKKHKQFVISTKIFDVLNMNNSQLNIEDAFGNDPYVYGLYSRSYEFLDICSPDFNLFSIPDINQTIFFMYFISTHNLHKLLNSCLKLKLFVNMNWEMDAVEKKSIKEFFNKYDTNFNNCKIEMIDKLIVNDNYTILHLASKNNFTHIVRYILDRKLISVNCIDSNERRALEFAKINNNEEVANLLTEEDDTATDSTNTLNLNLTNSLYDVVKDSNLSRVEESIKRGANLYIKNGKYTILETVAGSKSPEELKILIEQIGESNINMTGLLLHSLKENNISNAKYLLENYEINLGVTSSGKKSAMHLAAQRGDSNIIKLLLERGCDIDVLDADSKTPLFYAIENKNNDTLAYLIKHGANLTHKIRDSVGVMHVAARIGNSKILKILKDGGGNIEDLDARNQTPIYHSVYSLNIETVKFLTSCDTNLNNKFENNSSVMHVAAQYGNSEIMRILKNAGGNIEDCDANGKTPIYYSIFNKNKDTLNFLINSEANLKHRDFKNMTILHTAAEFGNKDVLSILFNNECDLEASDKNKRTPIFYAVEGENMETIIYLIERGANLNHISVDGSVLKFAENVKETNIIKYLKQSAKNN